ncbi:MAG: glycosyltransferase family 9 protein [Deltaproteobacteria bacterium]|nr:glycosyltransferase family 9 protein [Deltaproteobacteria bacterium]
MPLQLLERIDARFAAGNAQEALERACPGRVILDLGAIDLRQTMWSLPVVDAFRARFPGAVFEARGPDPQRALVAAHLPDSPRTHPALTRPIVIVSFSPHPASRVRVHEAQGTLDLVLPRALLGTRAGHECVRCVEPAQALGLDPSPLAPSLQLPSWRRREGRALARSLTRRAGGPLVALLPGGDATDCWKTEHFRAAALELQGRIGGVALQWGGDAPIDRSIRLVERQHPCVLAALLSQCAVCIADDNGWAHVAAAVDAPIITVHGATDPDVSGPVSRWSAAVWTTEGECESCENSTGKRRCLRCLAPGPVTDIAEKLAAERWPWDRLARWLP